MNDRWRQLNRLSNALKEASEAEDYDPQVLADAKKELEADPNFGDLTESLCLINWAELDDRPGCAILAGCLAALKAQIAVHRFLYKL